MSLQQITEKSFSPLDLLPHTDLREKLVELALSGVPAGVPSASAMALLQIKEALAREPVADLNVVVFGGGTGLSTIIGGDSRSASWVQDPFSGLKKLFPKTRSIVCITDDGGSTGELLKDLPLIALGDIRHVLLSSIQLEKLQKQYALTAERALQCVEVLAIIFNYRFSVTPESCDELLNECGLRDQDVLPPVIAEMLAGVIDMLFVDSRLAKVLTKEHCLGNLILASSIYEQIPAKYANEKLHLRQDILQEHIYRGIRVLCEILGADKYAVTPCATVPAELSVCYTNGVQVIGEHKSGFARRGYPVDHVQVNFCGEPILSDYLQEIIDSADIMIMAPGSLYSSLIPVFQVPGIADSVKKNLKALKILVSNLWVQTGETDHSISEPDRKFHLSDLLHAYHRNIPGGTAGLFDQVICMSLKDVPATVIQRYAIEGKIPIYLDREKVREQGIVPLECSIYAKASLRDFGVLRHDPDQFAYVVQTLWAGNRHVPGNEAQNVLQGAGVAWSPGNLPSMLNPCIRYRQIEEYLACIQIELEKKTTTLQLDIRKKLRRILWDHKDIPIEHLQRVKKIQCVATKQWKRSQNWDRVFSFYDPVDSGVKIRQDQFDSEYDFEVAFLVALGQSLLGNYAVDKEIKEVVVDQITLGKVYHLHVKKDKGWDSCFTKKDLTYFLTLARMVQNPEDEHHFTRLVNGEEGFTPPGLLFGLTYAWYLDNRFASHIEYKMAVVKIDHSYLIPEQVKMRSRREKLTDFFRKIVFSNR